MVAAGSWLVRVVFASVLIYLRAGPDTAPLTSDQMSNQVFLGQPTVYSPFFRLPEFLLGVACGALLLARDTRHDLAVGRWGATVSGLLIVGTFALLPKFHPREELFSAVTLPVILMLPGALLIYGLGSHEPAWARALGNSHTFRLLGEASYILYIIQFPFYYALMDLGLLGERDQNGNKEFFLYSVLLISAATAIYYFWERTAVAWLRDRFQPEVTLRPVTRQLA
jgi:peptidoglycan/LPS O-acetylase OafA/YrhL